MPSRIRRDVFYSLYPCGGPLKCPCQRREMIVSTNNGLVMGPVHNLLLQLFTPGTSKIQVFESYFFDTMITYNHHPRYVKHVLGRIYVFLALFGY